MKRMVSSFTHTVSNWNRLHSFQLILCRTSLFFNASAHVDSSQQESEFFIKADFNLPVDSATAKLLYFLKLSFGDIDIAFGAGIFVDINKANGMRKAGKST
jgi:hypothetical protein